MSFEGQEFPTKQLNEVGSFVAMLMDLEPVVQSKSSQKEENKYSNKYRMHIHEDAKYRVQQHL